MKKYPILTEQSLISRHFVKHYEIHGIHGEETIYRWVDDEEGVIRIKDMESSDILYKINLFKSYNIALDVVAVLEDVLLKRRFRKIDKIRSRCQIKN